ncbi:hypothetical protein EON63_22255 [archaeon]|nr:MAG: hypothetical protein EON63_22255 [archaeon]
MYLQKTILTHTHTQTQYSHEFHINFRNRTHIHTHAHTWLMFMSTCSGSGMKSGKRRATPPKSLPPQTKCLVVYGYSDVWCMMYGVWYMVYGT